MGDQGTTGDVVNAVQRSDWNNPFRALEGEFDKEHPSNDRTPQGVAQTTPGVGTSGTRDPTLEFFHKMMQDSPGFAREVMRLQQIMVDNPSPENQGEEQELRGSRPGKGIVKEAPVVHAMESEGDSSEGEEIRRLKRQVAALQEQLKENNRAGPGVREEARRSPRREDTRVENETWFETAGSHSHQPTLMPRSSRGNPFTQYIVDDPLPLHFKPVNYEYDGTTDPEDHVAKFKNVALLHQYTEGVKCRVFSTTLVGAAQQWFKQLAPESIASFEEFYDMFLQQFASARRSVKSSMHLMTVKQTSGKSLREYVAKFNMIALETPAADAKIKIHAFIQGLRSGPFFDSLVMNEPQDFGELLKRITPFIHLEEARLARQEETDKGRKKGEKRTDRDDVEEWERRIRNQIPRGSFRYDNRPREYQGGPPRTREPIIARGMQQLGHAMPVLSREVQEISEKELIPLNRPLGDILETARRVSGFTVPWGYTEQTRGIPNNVVYTYHNQYGHHTDRGKTLRLMIDKIVREGKLRQFVGEKRGHPVPQGRGNRNNPPPPPPGLPKQKIFMIFGGEAAEVSNHTRRTTIRQARQVENTLMEIKPGQAPEITFSHQDDRAMQRPHNDALVITIDIARVWVARTFVDTGSSVNVIYHDCLKQLDMNAKLQPST